MSLDDVEHPLFKYILVPYDINLPVQELTFEGREDNFREQLKTHLNNEKINCLNQQNFKDFKEQLKLKAEGKIDDDGLDKVVQGSSQNYQIIPLTLPSKANGYEGINAYIDSVGRIKDIPANARASRICSTDIRGDCFLSLVFDDEEIFRRKDFTLKDYERLIKNPPDATGR
ncbi:zinc finger MYND domain-containing protein, putative, partial [Eimeria acervulina]